MMAKTVKARIETLEAVMNRGDAPLQVIVAKSGQTEQAVEAFYKKYPQVEGLVIIIEKYH
jgi:hypothetical protein